MKLDKKKDFKNFKELLIDLIGTDIYITEKLSGIIVLVNSNYDKREKGTILSVGDDYVHYSVISNIGGKTECFVPFTQVKIENLIK